MISSPLTNNKCRHLAYFNLHWTCVAYFIHISMTVSMMIQQVILVNMNELQLLKDLEDLSRILNDHQKLNKFFRQPLYHLFQTPM